MNVTKSEKSNDGTDVEVKMEKQTAFGEIHGDIWTDKTAINAQSTIEIKMDKLFELFTNKASSDHLTLTTVMSELNYLKENVIQNKADLIIMKNGIDMYADQTQNRLNTHSENTFEQLNKMIKQQQLQINTLLQRNLSHTPMQPTSTFSLLDGQGGVQLLPAGQYLEKSLKETKYKQGMNFWEKLMWITRVNNIITQASEIYNNPSYKQQLWGATFAGSEFEQMSSLHTTIQQCWEHVRNNIGLTKRDIKTSLEISLDKFKFIAGETYTSQLDHLVSKIRQAQKHQAQLPSIEKLSDIIQAGIPTELRDVNLNKRLREFKTKTSEDIIEFLKQQSEDGVDVSKKLDEYLHQDYDTIIQMAMQIDKDTVNKQLLVPVDPINSTRRFTPKETVRNIVSTTPSANNQTNNKNNHSFRDKSPQREQQKGFAAFRSQQSTASKSGGN